MPYRTRRQHAAARRIQNAWRRNRMRRNYQVGAYMGRARFNRPKRVLQNMGRLVQYFKSVQGLSSTAQGTINFQVAPGNITGAGDFQTYASLYGEYKVLKITTKFFPTSVGSESLSTAAGAATFKRGDTVSFITTEIPSPAVTNITDVINKSSARVVASRRYHKRWIDRPPGFPKWGELNATGVVTVPDAWDSAINMFGDNYTPVQAPGPQVFWYTVTIFKVVFRSRQE